MQCVLQMFCVNAQDLKYPSDFYKLKPTSSNYPHKFHFGQGAIVKMASECVRSLAETS